MGTLAQDFERAWKAAIRWSDPATGRIRAWADWWMTCTVLCVSQSGVYVLTEFLFDLRLVLSGSIGPTFWVMVNGGLVMARSVFGLKILTQLTPLLMKNFYIWRQAYFMFTFIPDSRLGHGIFKVERHCPVSNSDVSQSGQSPLLGRWRQGRSSG